MGLTQDRWLISNLRRRKLLDAVGELDGEARAAALNELIADCEQELRSLRGHIMTMRHGPQPTLPPEEVIGVRRGVDPFGEDGTC